MYGTKSVNGSPAIERDGQIVLNVCDKNWDFANWLCALLNQLGRSPGLLLTQRDMELLKAMHRVFGRQVQNA
jgi:hypothetical protein